VSVDADRFPRLASYLGSLPLGLGAHGAAMTKASLVRTAILDKPITRPDGALPPELVALLRDPPLVSTWTRAVHVQALFLAIADEWGMTEDLFADWTYHLQKRLFRSAVYRVLAVVTRPRMLLAGARLRWSSFHRGTTLEVTTRDHENAATLMLRFPRGLYTRLNLVGFGRGFQAVVELSHGGRVQAALAAVEPTHAAFAISWDELDDT
jgi:hypothetical protein